MGKNKTIAEMRREINKIVSELNKDVIVYQEKGRKNKVFDKALAKLQKQGGTSGRTRQGIGKGSSLRTKKEIESYLNELKRVQKFDTFTPSGIRRQREQERKATESFLKNHPDYTEKDFKRVSDLFGQLTPSEVEQFGSEQVVEIARYGKSKNLRQKTIAKIIKEQLNNDELLTVEDFNDTVRQMIDERAESNARRRLK